MLAAARQSCPDTKPSAKAQDREVGFLPATLKRCLPLLKQEASTQEHRQQTSSKKPIWTGLIFSRPFETDCRRFSLSSGWIRENRFSRFKTRDATIKPRFLSFERLRFAKAETKGETQWGWDRCSRGCAGQVNHGRPGPSTTTHLRRERTEPQENVDAYKQQPRSC